MLQNAYCNVTCERPPRPCQFGTDSSFDGTATPPFQGGESIFLALASRLGSVFSGLVLCQGKPQAEE